MNQKREIVIGTVYRILAGFVCFLCILELLLMPEALLEYFGRNFFSMASLVTIFPLFLYCAIFGKVPEIVLRHASDELFEDIEDAGKLFARCDWKTGVVLLTAVAVATFIILG